MEVVEAEVVDFINEYKNDEDEGVFEIPKGLYILLWWWGGWGFEGGVGLDGGKSGWIGRGYNYEKELGGDVYENVRKREEQTC